MRGLRKYGLLCLLLTAAISLRAKVEEGLYFRSYEVVPDLRTSLDIPVSGEHIAFKDSLTVVFDIRLDLDRGAFGYVCRLFIDENDPLDLLLSTPMGGTTFLGATGDHRNIVPVLSDRALFPEWQRIRICVEDRGGKLRFLVNGREVYARESSLQRHGGTVNFGRGDGGGSVTTDVAPMVLRNLRIKADNHRPAQWPLQSEAEFKSARGVRAQLSNPVWLQNYNREWRKVWQEEMPSVTYICPDTLRGRIWFVANGKVSCYDVARNAAVSRPSARRLSLGLATDDFVILPDGTLAYADAETLPAIIRYSAAGGDWESDSPRVRSSPYLHHNTLFVPADSSYVYLFGYGQYRYQKTARRWRPAGDAPHDLDMPGVFPRYLSGAAVRDGKNLNVRVFYRSFYTLADGFTRVIRRNAALKRIHRNYYFHFDLHSAAPRRRKQ